MQLLETTPTYYRVQLDSGQVLTIAKTAGTTQMLGAGGAGPNAGAQSAPSPVQGMAGGGVMPGEIDPYAGDTIGMGVTLPEFLPDPFTQTVQTGVVPQFGPGQVAAPPGPMAAPAPMATPPPAGPMTGRGAVATVATPTGDVYTTAEGKPVAETTEPGGEAKAVAESKTAGGQYEPEPGANPGPDMDLAQLFQPSWLPGQQGASGPGPDPSALNAATTALAETQAKAQEELASHYASMRPAGAPPNTPVDPGQFYERVGRMFGADNPKNARLIGGIAAGLIAAVGEFGAALSHRQNVAAGMIQNAIAENIRQQEGANNLSRQQWLDQTAYATQMWNQKTLELAAKAKAPEIRAQANVQVARNNLAYLGARVKDGSMTAQEIGPLAKIENAKAALAPFASGLGTTPTGPGAAIREKMGDVPIIGDLIGPDKATDIEIANRNAADTEWLKAMQPNSDRPINIKDARAQYPGLLYERGDYGETLAWKTKKKLMMLKSSEAIYGARARGQDPKGAGTVTPNARPN